MTKQKKIKIVKVNNDTIYIDKPQVFPRMPRLYLELLENKAKIKQDLINKEYVMSEYKDSTSYKEESADNKVVKRPEKTLESRLDNILNEKENLTQKDKEIAIAEDSDSSSLSSESDSDESDIDVNEKDTDSYSRNKKDLESYSKNEDNKSISTSSENSIKDDSYTPDISKRLTNLLNESPDPVSVSSKYSKKSNDKYSKQNNYNIRSVSKNPQVAPSLAELEAQGGYKHVSQLRDINNIPMSEQHDEDLKREIMFKMELLKKSYPTSIIPEFSIHSDYNTMKKTYDSTVRRLSLDSSVENYKTYLIGGFMACEFLLGNFFKFDMQGFTQQQILSMNTYEKLLIELGEKSYVPSGSKWPVELRLLFMIIMNAAFFIISKMIMKKTGANLLGMINNMNSSATQPSVSQKRKMKGPDIDLNNIPDE